MAPQENSISRILYTPDVYINEFGGGNGHLQLFKMLAINTGKRIYYAFKTPHPELMVQYPGLIEVNPTDYTDKPNREARFLPCIYASEMHLNVYETLHRIAFHDHEAVATRVMDWMRAYEKVYQEIGRGFVTYFDYAPIAQLAFKFFKEIYKKESFSEFIYGAGVCNIPLTGKTDVPSYQSFLHGDSRHLVNEEKQKWLDIFNVDVKTIIGRLNQYSALNKQSIAEIFQPDYTCLYGKRIMDPYAGLRSGTVRYFEPGAENFITTPQPEGKIRCFGYVSYKQAINFAMSQARLPKGMKELVGDIIVSGQGGANEITLLKERFPNLNFVDRFLSNKDEIEAFNQADLIFTNGSIGFINMVLASKKPFILLPSDQPDQQITAMLAQEHAEQTGILFGVGFVTDDVRAQKDVNLLEAKFYRQSYDYVFENL